MERVSGKDPFSQGHWSGLVFSHVPDLLLGCKIWGPNWGRQHFMSDWGVDILERSLKFLLDSVGELNDPYISLLWFRISQNNSCSFGKVNVFAILTCFLLLWYQITICKTFKLAGFYRKCLTQIECCETKLNKEFTQTAKQKQPKWLFFWLYTPNLTPWPCSNIFWDLKGFNIQRSSDPECTPHTSCIFGFCFCLVVIFVCFCFCFVFFCFVFFLGGWSYSERSGPAVPESVDYQKDF